MYAPIIGDVLAIDMSPDREVLYAMVEDRN
jgi:hypothetical protein